MDCSEPRFVKERRSDRDARCRDRVRPSATQHGRGGRIGRSRCRRWGVQPTWSRHAAGAACGLELPVTASPTSGRPTQHLSSHVEGRANPSCAIGVARCFSGDARLDAMRLLRALPPSPATVASFTSLLNRRARHAAVGTVHAAVTRPGLQHPVALLAFVEPLAGIGRHRLGLAVPTGRTSQCRLEDDATHFAAFATVEG